jgi:hypothetical protein
MFQDMATPQEVELAFSKTQEVLVHPVDIETPRAADVVISAQRDSDGLESESAKMLQREALPTADIEDALTSTNRPITVEALYHSPSDRDMRLRWRFRVDVADERVEEDVKTGKITHRAPCRQDVNGLITLAVLRSP